MALLATTAVTVAGTTQTLAAASAGGDTAHVGDGLFLVVKNGDATSKTVTLVTPATLETGDAYPDKAYTVAAGATALIPLLDVYRNKATGLASITYSAVTSVTVGVFSV
jgi:hypothetical protein